MAFHRSSSLPACSMLFLHASPGGSSMTKRALLEGQGFIFKTSDTLRPGGLLYRDEK